MDLEKHNHGKHPHPGNALPYYHGRYSTYWEDRLGLIPELPTSYDNANDIYDLLAWLQRGMKQLMDDFANLEMEFEDFKNALIELLIKLIPEIIREFIKSEEFRQYIFNLIDEWYENNLKEIIENILNDIKNIKQDIQNIFNRIEELETSNKILQNIINNLIDSGAMDEDGNMLHPIVYGRINVFSETQNSASYFLRSSKNNTRGDIFAKRAN